MPTSSTIVTADWALSPSNSGTTIVRNALIAWGEDGKIVFFGSESDWSLAPIKTSFESQSSHPPVRLDLGNSILSPGLVNAHCHAAMTLLRGAADDLPLMDWLQKRIWPMEGALVDPEFVQTGTVLAAAEMLLGGTTTCADMYFYPQDAARAFIAMGMRAQLAMPIIEFPTRYASDPDRYLALALEARDALKSEPLLSFALGPHAPYSVNDETFQRVVAYCAELGMPIHTHLQETAKEVEDSLAQHGERPTKRLERLGLLSPDFVGAHGVHVNVEDMARLAKASANIAHCPSSNLKLASGIAPVTALTKAGVNVALGTDGAASNNRLDMFEEMRLAALLAKVQANDASAFPAAAAFRAATINGAQALGLSKMIGSLEAGKHADIVAVSLESAHMQPMFDPLSHVVYAATAADVTHTWVHGRARVTNRELVDDAARMMNDTNASLATLSEKVARMAAA